MSVYVLSPEQFGAIAATLRITRDSLREPIFPRSMAERFEYQVFVAQGGKSEEEYALSLIDPFVYRLYIANVMAERYTYMKDGQAELVIPLIELACSRPMELTELLKTLESLSYNLVTNGGNTFLGVKDDQKLEQVISAIKSEIIRVRAA